LKKHKEENKDMKTKDFVRSFLAFFRNKYDAIKKDENENIPQYICDFINKINYDVSSCSDAKEIKRTWKKYQEEEFFMNELNKIMKNELAVFLGINHYIGDDNECDSDSDIDDE